MSNKIIKITPNAAGRAVVNLYGKDFDVTEQAGKNGKGELKTFGAIYQFEIIRKKTATKVEPLSDNHTQETDANDEAGDE